MTIDIEAPGRAVARDDWGVDAAAVGLAVCRHRIVAAGAPLLLSGCERAIRLANEAIPVARSTDSGVVHSIIATTRAVAVVAGLCGYHGTKIIFSTRRVAVFTLLVIRAMCSAIHMHMVRSIVRHGTAKLGCM